MHWCSENKPGKQREEERQVTKTKNSLLEVTLTESEPLLENSKTKTHLSVPTYLTGLVHTNQLCKIWQHSPEPWHLVKFPPKSIGQREKERFIACIPHYLPHVYLFKIYWEKEFIKEERAELNPCLASNLCFQKLTKFQIFFLH